MSALQNTAIYVKVCVFMCRDDWSFLFYKEDLNEGEAGLFNHQGVFHSLYKFTFIRFICNTAT